MHGDLDADGGAFRDAEEVHVQRQVLDGVELEVARDHAMLGAVDIDMEKRGEEAPGVNTLAQFGMVERDHQRGFVVAIDDARNTTGRPCCPGGPLATFRTHHRFEFENGSHCL